jgi:hypothetical protein
MLSDGSPTFDLAADALRLGTGLSANEARGTLRLICREAGLRPDLVTEQKLQVIVPHLLPRALSARGIAGAADICRRILASLAAAPLQPGAADPAEMFRRINLATKQR